MARIGAVGRTSAVWSKPAQNAGAVDQPTSSDGVIPPIRALVVLDGGRSEARTIVDPIGAGRPSASFVAQLLVANEPTLRPSRLERARMAAAHYAETARRLA